MFLVHITVSKIKTTSQSPADVHDGCSRRRENRIQGTSYKTKILNINIKRSSPPSCEINCKDKLYFVFCMRIGACVFVNAQIQGILWTVFKKNYKLQQRNFLQHEFVIVCSNLNWKRKGEETKTAYRYKLIKFAVEIEHSFWVRN